MKKRLGRDRPAAVLQAGGAAAALALLALTLSSCISLKENDAVQTTPGKVTIRTVVCASDYAGTKGLPECGPNNLFAGDDNNRVDAPNDAKTGQLLVGFRVPGDVDGPAGFSTKNPALSFTRSDTYAGELQRIYPALGDQKWLGYISAVDTYDPAGPRVLTMEPEFTLPANAGSTFRWRTVVGFREGNDAAAPVSCPQPPPPNAATRCVETPPENRVRADEADTVSNFGVQGGATTTVFPGTTAVVPFTLRYLDSARLGRQSFGLVARTTLERTNPRTTGQTSVSPNGTADVEALVPVPTGTRPGSYKVTLLAGIGAPAVTRAAEGTIVVARLPQEGPPPLPAAGKVAFKFRPQPAGGRKVLRMLVTQVPPKATVASKCKGRGCAFTSKTIKGRRTVNLVKQFRGRTLRPVTVITIRIAGPNRIAKEISFTIRRGQKKTVGTVKCRPPLGKTALKCYGGSKASTSR